MSVEFRGVSKYVGRGNNRRLLFDDINLHIEPGDRIAILGPPKSGKSTFLRMVCGTDYADDGTIERTSSVSWPLPTSDFMVSASSVATNIRFMMRLYGLDDENLLREIAARVDISEFLNKRLGECPKHVRSRLALALGVGLGFDVCIFDERVAAVDKEFKARAAEIVKSLDPKKAIVVATSQTKEVADLCEKVFVIEGGGLKPFPSMDEGVEYLKSLTAKKTDEGPDESDTGPEVVEEEFLLEVGI